MDDTPIEGRFQALFFFLWKIRLSEITQTFRIDDQIIFNKWQTQLIPSENGTFEWLRDSYLLKRVFPSKAGIWPDERWAQKTETIIWLQIMRKFCVVYFSSCSSASSRRMNNTLPIPKRMWKKKLIYTIKHNRNSRTLLNLTLLFCLLDH